VERIPAELRTAVPEKYRSEFNASSVAAIDVVPGGKIVQSFLAAPNHRYPDVEMLSAVSELYLATAGPDPGSNGRALSKAGLWRDTNGKLWCGGACGYGQQCCAFTENVAVCADEALQSRRIRLRNS